MAAAIIGVAFAASRRFRRFEISGNSMIPTLHPGDWVLVDQRAFRARIPKPGQLVVARDPRKPARHLIKRVASVDLHGGIQIEGDNPAESTDSRDFGPIRAASVEGRVRWRYWPLGRMGAVR